MNEVKRQLDKKMGDTTERTERIIMNVEQKKRTAPTKRKLSIIYYVTFAAFAVLLGFSFFLNPFQTNNMVTAPTPNTPEEPHLADDLLDLKSFFKQDGDLASFVGDFYNEFYSFSETTTWLNNQYVQLVNENESGLITRQIYKVTSKKIELVLEDMSDNINKPSIDELETYKPISILLIAPIEDGTTFEDKSITYPVEFKTPYNTFNDVVQVTVKEGDSTVDYYYAKNFGLIGRVIRIEDGYQITSLLSSINSASVVDEKDELQVFNKTTNQLETLPFHLFSSFDPLFLFKQQVNLATATYEIVHQTDDFELGIVEMDYSQYTLVALLIKRGETMEVIRGINSESVNWVYSPNKQFIAFCFTSENKIGNSIPNGNLVVFDLNSMDISNFYTDEDITMYSPPIFSYKWLDNSTIEYLVPDIDIRDSEELLQWQKSADKPTKPVIGTVVAN